MTSSVTRWSAGSTASGATVVELLHHGFDRTGAGSAADHRGFENGWGMLQLEALLGRVRL